MKSMMRKIAVLTTIAALGLCPGCMWGRVQMNDPGIRERAARIRVGVTREAELRSLLGAEPTMRMPLRDRTVMSYTYADTKTNGLMLMAVNFMKTQTVADTIYVETDGEGIVRRVAVPPYREITWQFWPF